MRVSLRAPGRRWRRVARERKPGDGVGRILMRRFGLHPTPPLGASRCALRPVLFVGFLVCTAAAWGQPGKREPHIGYVYPAGGQQGSTFLVTVGGQNLRGVNGVYVTGEGVRASIVEYGRPVRNLQQEQRYELARRMMAVRDKRLAEMAQENPDLVRQWEKATGQAAFGVSPKKLKDEDLEQVNLPNHPLLYGLDDMSLRELAHLRHELTGFRRSQLNAQIAESALIEVTVEPGAALGDRELRLMTGAGFTNPMCFQIGKLPETRELEPNDPGLSTRLPEAAAVDLPILFNGQIKPGDVDHFRFNAKKGQRLVIAAQARSLIPYLADAVPGWFQATMALYDADGAEVAFVDDFRFDPDPILFYEIPKDGVYELEIHDSIYRGREDFVYRIAVGELPFVTAMFPLGGRAGSKTVASASGWHLPEKRLPLDTHADGGSIRQTALHAEEGLSNQVPYAVDALPDRDEKESNDTEKKAQRINLPQIVNGRIDFPGDVDVFRFKGRAGDEVVAEVQARTLHSPMDSLLRLTDKSGQVLEWNDDYMLKEGHLHTGAGLVTHHADSYLRAQLPEDGAYYVHVADSQRQGGKAYAYRLRISPPQPDFELRVTPSSINVPAGRAAQICVHVLRKDGFDGEIELALNKAPSALTLDGGKIPANRDSIRMTLSASRDAPDEPLPLQLEGHASVDGKTVRRPVAPAEDMMQAFLWRHLAPSQELIVTVLGTGPRAGPPVKLADRGPLRLPEGGSVQVRVKTPPHPALKDVELALSDPPEGVTLEEVTVVPEGLAFTLKASGEMDQTGFVDNLIVEAFGQVERRTRGGKSPTKKHRVSFGILPAIPLEIVPQ